MFSTEERTHLNEILSQVTCGDLVDGQNVIILDYDMTLMEAGNVLIDNEIISALVRNPTKTSYVGVFSYRTILHYFLETYHNSPPPVHPDLMIGIFPLDACVGRYVQDQHKGFQCVRATDNVVEAIKILGQGWHRLSVMDATGHAVGVISQSSIIKMLGEMMIEDKEFELMLKKPLNELEIGQTNVLYVYEHQKVIDAMILMYRTNLSALAVMDVDSKICGNISMSDIKHVFKTNYQRMLWYSCEDFLKYVRTKVSIEKNRGNDTFPYFPVSGKTFLSTVIRKLLATKVHRLWVVDVDSLSVPGCVSMTDVIHVIQENLLDDEQSESSRTTQKPEGETASS